jgi:adenine/guanine phosphoribosyltransferase-like PRPP-binding protein
MSADGHTESDLAGALDVLGVTRLASAKARPLDDPSATQLVGQEIAARARDCGIDVVLAWNQPEDVILAYAVSLALSTPIVVAVQEEGIVELDRPVPSSARVLVLADAFRAGNDLRALVRLIDHHGGEVAAVAALTETAALRHEAPAGAKVVALAPGTAPSNAVPA